LRHDLIAEPRKGLDPDDQADAGEARRDPEKFSRIRARSRRQRQRDQEDEDRRGAIQDRGEAGIDAGDQSAAGSLQPIASSSSATMLVILIIRVDRATGRRRVLVGIADRVAGDRSPALCALRGVPTVRR
jgi:hypothetical protein